MPPILLARKWGTGTSHLLGTFPHWAMGTSGWVGAQRRKGTVLESHSVQPRLGYGGKLCVFLASAFQQVWLELQAQEHPGYSGELDNQGSLRVGRSLAWR